MKHGDAELSMIRHLVLPLLAMAMAATPAAATSRGKALRDVMCLARDELQDASDRFALNQDGVARAHQWLIERNGHPATDQRTDDGGFHMIWNGFVGNGPSRHYERKLSVSVTPNAASGLVFFHDACKAM